MQSLEEYLRGIFTQILDSHHVISNLRDQPGDLETIKKELAKITGQLQVAAKKLESSNDDSDKIVKLTSACKNFIENYDFSREIETMSKLYSNDPDRLKNLRLKIIESLNDQKLFEKIESISKAD